MSSAEEMSVPFQGADIVVLGEVHDNPIHHANQARIVAALEPSALVFEMITPHAARQVTPRSRRNAVELEAALQWNASGWPDFSMYFPIFAAAPDAAVYGGALPRDAVRQAIGDGAAAVFGGAAALFGLDQPLPDDQLTARMQLQQDAHCGALPDEMLPGMVEAQRLRDAALARATVAALAHAKASETDGPVIVITGNGHAREDWGMPAALRAYFASDPPDIRTLAQFESTTDEAALFTSTTVTKPADREYPCKAFAK